MSSVRASPPLYGRATLHYLRGFDPVPVDVDVFDARPADGLSWKENGFERLDHRSDVEHWEDAAAPGSRHYDEIGLLARSLTGCDQVIHFPGLHRNPAAGLASEDYKPILFVHSDYTESYRAMIETDGHPYRKILEPSMKRAGVSGDDIRRSRRIVTLQFWRNLGPRRPDYPLALCDARTVGRAALTPIPVPTYGGLQTEFESFAVAPPERPSDHRWYTFPQLTADEVVVFRAYDSERAARGQPFWTPHSAFLDATAGDSAPPRESIEMRAICLFQP